MRPAIDIVRDCFALSSMPIRRVPGWRDDMKWVSIGPFRFHYDRHSTGEGLYIRIVHPDGEYLEIVAKSYCTGYPTPDWDRWTTGPWDAALKDALVTMDAANETERERRRLLRESQIQKENAERTATLAKFGALFAATEVDGNAEAEVVLNEASHADT